MDPKAHLDSERIMISMVDERELSPSEREHLSLCPDCAAARARLVSQLSGLSAQAVTHTPVSRKKIALPAEQQANAMAWFMRWSLGMAAAVATVVIVAVFLLGRMFPGGQGFDEMKLASETARDEMLLAEVRALENDPLPRAYSEIIPDAGVSLDEDFFDFLIPLDSNGSETQKT